MIEYKNSGKCEWCGRYYEHLQSHHLIPRWCGGTDEDIINVCASCHHILEVRFRNFIFYGTFKQPRFENYDKHKKRSIVYYYKNREKRLKYNKEYHIKYREERIKYLKEWKKKNRDKYLKGIKEWRKKHPGIKTFRKIYKRIKNAHPGMAKELADKFYQKMKEKGYKITNEGYQKYYNYMKKIEEELLEKRKFFEERGWPKPLQAYHLYIENFKNKK
jgi:hypothetical protein